MIYEDHRYCSHCNYAVSKVEIENLVTQDINCPRCNTTKLHMFYDYGSQVHLRNWEDYVKARRQWDAPMFSVVPFPRREPNPKELEKFLRSSYE